MVSHTDALLRRHDAAIADFDADMQALMLPPLTLLLLRAPCRR